MDYFFTQQINKGCVCVCVSFLALGVRICLPMQETRVWSLGQEDPLEDMATYSSVFLSAEFHGRRSLAGYGP